MALRHLVAASVAALGTSADASGQLLDRGLPTFPAEHPGPELVDALRTHGAMVMTQVPGLAVANHRALEALASCGANGLEGFHHRALNDGSERFSLAALDGAGVVPEPVSSRCAGLEDELALLRGVIGSIGEHFVHNVKDSFSNLGPARRRGGFEALVAEGRALEHFHLYSPASANASAFEAVPLHIDSGAFLVLSKALTFHKGGDLLDGDDSSFSMRMRDRSTMSPRLAEDSALILTGEAMTAFLGANVYVPPHAVSLQGITEGSLRAWHGRMYLFPEADLNDRGQTAKSLFMAPLGQGAADKFTAGLKTDCDTAVETCWMALKDVCVPRCADGQLQQCLLGDLTEDGCGPNVMNPACKFRCPVPIEAPVKNETAPPQAVPVVSQDSFCDTAAHVDMYMSGFTSTHSRDRPCIVLLFKGWRLDSALKFALACITVVLMGIATQGLIALRPIVQQRTSGMSSLSIRSVESIMFGLQVTLGWFMMLVAMTFSTELFCSATGGLIAGHFVFAEVGSTKVLGTPCCNAVSNRKAPTSSARAPFLTTREAFTAVLRVEGMTCNSCTATIEAAALAVDGVVSCWASVSQKRADVKFQRPATAQAVLDAIDAVGFDAELAAESRLETELSTSVVASHMHASHG